MAAMAVRICENDVKLLGDKLVGLAGLSPEERSLLWAVFTIAADVLNPKGSRVGTTKLVESDTVNDLTVELDGTYDDFLNQFDGTPVPDRVAKAFAPGPIRTAAGSDEVQPLVALKVTDGMSLKVKTPKRPTKPTKPAKSAKPNKYP